MKVIPIPVLEDNYTYVLIDDESRVAAVVDCADAFLVAKVLNQTDANVTSMLVTHHHWDHCCGNVVFTAYMPDLTVYGADTRIPEINHVCRDGEEFMLGSLHVTVFHTPFHTKGHVCYYVVDPSTHEKAIFTGDSLLAGGISNRFFEGHIYDIYGMLFNVMYKLPDETLVYGGHERTKSNLTFALSIEPGNVHVKNKWHSCQERSATMVPSTIGEEKTYNPFLRLHEPTVQAASERFHPVEVLAELLKMKELAEQRAGISLDASKWENEHRSSG